MRPLHPTRAGSPVPLERSVWNAFGGHPQGTAHSLAADDWRRTALNEAMRESLLRPAAHTAPPNPTAAPSRATVAAPGLPWLRSTIADGLRAVLAVRQRNRPA